MGEIYEYNRGRLIVDEKNRSRLNYPELEQAVNEEIGLLQREGKLPSDDGSLSFKLKVIAD